MAYRKKWTASAGFWISISLMVLLIPWAWLFAFAAAVLIHECAHMAAAVICGGTINTIHLDASGIRMDLSDLPVWQELICAAAGPAGSLLLLFLAGLFPRVAICAGIQLLYNLLPVYPLDGGRILRCISEIVFPPRIAASICRIVQTGAYILILILGLAGTLICRLGLGPGILCAMVFYRAVKNSLQTGARAGTIVLP